MIRDELVQRLRELHKFAAEQHSRDWDEQDEIRELFGHVFRVACDAADYIERTPKVRALEWKQIEPDYWVTDKEWRHNIRQLGQTFRTCAGDKMNAFDSLEAAKAAAQADYERRILSALEPTETQT